MTYIQYIQYIEYIQYIQYIKYIQYIQYIEYIPQSCRKEKRNAYQPHKIISINYKTPGVKQTRRSIEHPPYLAPKLKKEYSYVSTPLVGRHDLF
jgi:hypothetical protein